MTEDFIREERVNAALRLMDDSGFKVDALLLAQVMLAALGQDFFFSDPRREGG